MTKRINVTSKLQKRVRDSGTARAHIDPTVVARELGAVRVSEMPDTGGPISLLAVRQELQKRLQSTGGRPALRGAKRRQKVPLTDSEWHKLEKIAADLTARGFKTTAGQVASILLHQAIREVESSSIEERKAVGQDRS